MDEFKLSKVAIKVLSRLLVLLASLLILFFWISAISGIFFIVGGGPFAEFLIEVFMPLTMLLSIVIGTGSLTFPRIITFWDKHRGTYQEDLDEFAEKISKKNSQI